jgi:hypothetical protein
MIFASASRVLEFWALIGRPRRWPSSSMACLSSPSIKTRYRQHCISTRHNWWPKTSVPTRRLALENHGMPHVCDCGRALRPQRFRRGRVRLDRVRKELLRSTGARITRSRTRSPSDAMSSACGGNASSINACLASTSVPARAVPEFFPPEVVVQVKALACERHARGAALAAEHRRHRARGAASRDRGDRELTRPSGASSNVVALTRLDSAPRCVDNT